MKRFFLGLIFAASTSVVWASGTGLPSGFKPSINNIPAKFSSSSKTDTVEWGCPIQEVVQAKNSADALHKIGQACMEDVRRAAAEKPGVFDVINISVIWPDVAVKQTAAGFHLEGTVFLETLVMKGSEE